MAAREQVDDVQVRSIGQRPTPEPSQSQNEQLTRSNPAMPFGELLLGRLLRRFERGLGNPRQGGSNVEWVLRCFDQLHPQREAGFAGDDPNTVEPVLIGVAPLSPSHCVCEVLAGAGQIERASVDQGVDQFGATGDSIGKRRGKGKAIGQQLHEPRSRLEQAEEIDRALHPFEQAFPPSHGPFRIIGCGKRRDQLGPDRFECRQGGGAAKGRITSVAPANHALFKSRVQRVCGFIRLEMRAVGGDRDLILRQQCIISIGDRCREAGDMIEPVLAASKSVESRDIVERLALRDRVGLLVGHHLKPMLDAPEAVVTFAQIARIVRADSACGCQGIQRGARVLSPDGWIAPAVNELVCLRKKLDLANAAAAKLDVVAGSGLARPGLLVADPMGQPAHFVDGTEIEAPPPHERPYVVEKGLARSNIACTGARANKGGALPSQCRTLVMRDGSIDGNCQRADFRSGTEAQIDPEYITFARDLRQHAHHVTGIALGRFARLVAIAARQRCRIVQEYRIDVRRIVQLARSVLSQRQSHHPFGRSAFCSLRNGGFDRMMQGAIGK